MQNSGERIGPTQAWKLLGHPPYPVIKELVRKGYVKGERVGRRFHATEQAWREGYSRWLAEHGRPATSPRGEDELGVNEAARFLGVSSAVTKALVKRGYVQTHFGPRGSRLAPKQAWAEGYEAYLRDQGRSLDAVLPAWELYDPLHSTVMTENVFTGFELVYGGPPRCYVCGRVLEEGTRWRWYVPMNYQYHELRRRGWPFPIPAIGCASGHEGTVIEVLDRYWRIGPDGSKPKEVSKDAAADGQEGKASWRIVRLVRTS